MPSGSPIPIPGSRTGCGRARWRSRTPGDEQSAPHPPPGPGQFCSPPPLDLRTFHPSSPVPPSPSPSFLLLPPPPPTDRHRVSRERVIRQRAVFPRCKGVKFVDKVRSGLPGPSPEQQSSARRALRRSSNQDSKLSRCCQRAHARPAHITTAGRHHPGIRLTTHVLSPLSPASVAFAPLSSFN